MKDFEILSVVNCIPDDQAESTDFGWDSDADDCLPIGVSVINGSMTKSLNLSGNSSTPQSNIVHSVEFPLVSSTSTSTSLSLN